MPENKRHIDFIGIGAFRAGTSWLTDCLRAHPDICISNPKEIRYFNRYLFPIGTQRGQKNPNAEQPLPWYLNHFRHRRPDQICGEYSPIYLYDRDAPARIQWSFPHVKLLVCLRHPADRAYSQYWQIRGLGLGGDLTFEQALEQEPVYFDVGRYTRQLRRYFDLFPQEQILVLFSEEMRADPEAGLRQVLEFLEVRTDVPIETQHANPNRPAQVKAKGLNRFIRLASQQAIGMGLGSVMSRLRNVGVSQWVRKALDTPLTYGPMQPETRQWLNEQYREEIEELEALLQRDLSPWKG